MEGLGASEPHRAWRAQCEECTQGWVLCRNVKGNLSWRNMEFKNETQIFIAKKRDFDSEQKLTLKAKHIRLLIA